jgi:hypothetical protein
MIKKLIKTITSASYDKNVVSKLLALLVIINE